MNVFIRSFEFVLEFYSINYLELVTPQYLPVFIHDKWISFYK